MLLFFMLYNTVLELLFNGDKCNINIIPKIVMWFNHSTSSSIMIQNENVFFKTEQIVIHNSFVHPC